MCEEKLRGYVCVFDLALCNKKVQTFFFFPFKRERVLVLIATYIQDLVSRGYPDEGWGQQLAERRFSQLRYASYVSNNHIHLDIIIAQKFCYTAQFINVQSTLHFIILCKCLNNILTFQYVYFYPSCGIWKSKL